MEYYVPVGVEKVKLLISFDSFNIYRSGRWCDRCGVAASSKEKMAEES